MKIQSTDILAKLLATENLTVVRQNTVTASFDIKNRVLTLPQWKDLTLEVEEMLVLHEVGHALYTTVDGYGIVHTPEKRHLHGYANILEDVRIEKKMKDRYPGSRKTFNAGYTQLNDKDFFGVNKRNDLAELLLIDRINLFYKVGYNAGIPFTAEEYVFVQKADKTVTEQDVIQLAEEIFEYSKAKKQEEYEEEQITLTYGDAGETDVDAEVIENANLEPETIDAFENKLEMHADLTSRTYYFDAKFEIEDSKSPLVSHKTVLSEMANGYDEIDIARIRMKASQFRQDSTNIVNYLVKEFEMRKSASAYKRTKMSRLGQLDTRKLFAYQLKDDIFKQIATVQEGKKHGMIFLLDWSGSMMNCMSETVEQVINLAMFCQKINIPYQVLAFSDGYPRHQHIDVHRIGNNKNNPTGIDDMRQFSLLELFSNKMNTRDFNRMIELLLDNPWYRRNGYGLNGTPLNTALLYMVDYIGHFIRINDVEKMNLITLTDGESNTMHRYNYAKDPNLNTIVSGPTYIIEDGAHKRVNVTSILRDPITRKEYQFTDVSGEQTAALLQLLKDRYNLRSIGFYITGNNLRSFERFLKHTGNMKPSSTYAIAVGIQEKMRREKAAVLKDIAGRDEMYIIASNNKIVDEDLEDVKQEMSAAQISKHLGKMFNSRKSSRVVLNSFIGQVA